MAEDPYAALIPAQAAQQPGQPTDPYSALVPARPARAQARAGTPVLAPANQPSNPLTAITHLLAPAGNVALQAAGKVGDILSRPGQAVQALVAGPPGTQNAAQNPASLSDFGRALDALMHGVSPEQQQANRDSIKTGLGVKGAIDALPSGFIRGTADAAVDTALDPTTYLGGLGLIKKGVQAGSKALEVGAIQGASAAGRTAENLVGRVANTLAGPSASLTAQQAAQSALTTAGKIIASPYDALVPKGAVRRQLIQDNGAAGIGQYNQLYAAKNAGKSQMNELANTLQPQFADAVKGLSTKDEDAVYRALNSGAVDSLTPELQTSAQKIKTLTDSMAYLAGNKGLQDHLSALGPAGPGFVLPDSLQKFASDAPRGIQGVENYRPAYIPHAYYPRDAADFAAHDAGLIPASGAITPEMANTADLLGKTMGTSPQQTIKGLAGAQDPFLNARMGTEELLDPAFQRQIMQNRINAGAKAIAGYDTADRVASDFGASSFAKVPQAAKDFFTDTFTPQSEKNGLQLGADAVRSVADAPKYGFFFNPVRHMANIASLAALHDPIAAAQGAGRFALSGILPAAAESQERAVANAVKGGAVSVSQDRDIPAIINAIPGISQLYRASNKTLWGFDDAMKATAYDRLLKQGVKPADAAAEVGAKMIDYGDKSDFTKALGYVAPFATYRSKLPGAVAQSVAENPQYAQVAGRASSALAGAQQPTDDMPGGSVKNYLPLAEVSRLLEVGPKDDANGNSQFSFKGPADYTRSTLSYPYKDLLTLLMANGLGQGERGRFFTNYKPVFGADGDKKPVALSQLFGTIPGGSEALSAIGQNPYENRGFLTNLLEGSLGTRYYPPR